MAYRYLDGVQCPSDLKQLDDAAMGVLAEEIRDYLVHTVEKTGGHLASNLGVVELTLALHRTFDFTKDRLIFDVGHQCYVHKLLTGRREQFDTLRQIGGLSGFPKIEESEYDAFGTGHSSTSLSAAIGISEALHLEGSDAYTVAVIGDGAFTGGMIHEALNNVKRDRKLILILNENEMSISRNIGQFAAWIARIRASAGYYRTKNRTAGVIARIPLIGKGIFRAMRGMKQALKNLMYGSNLFEELGLYYLGPVDGNDYKKVSLLLSEAVAYGKSAVIHLHTVKGKGYAPAEENPSRYHGLSPAGGAVEEERFSDRLGEYLRAMGEEDSAICAVTAAMGEATGLEGFKKAHAERFYDVGIAEAHALTFSAGLAAMGKKPVFAVYSSFLQRGYDNVLHDIVLQGLPMTLCIDRAGLNGGDGATHHGIFDVAMLSQMPGVRIIAPCSFDSLRQALSVALASDRLCAIRYHNGGEIFGSETPYFDPEAPLMPRRDWKEGERKEVIIVTYGRLAKEARRASEMLGTACGTVLLETLAPYAETAEALVRLLPEETKVVLFAEEGIRSGGAGMLLADLVRECRPSLTVRVLGVEEPFTVKAGAKGLYAAYGIDAQAMCRAVRGGKVE